MFLRCSIVLVLLAILWYVDGVSGDISSNWIFSWVMYHRVRFSMEFVLLFGSSLTVDFGCLFMFAFLFLCIGFLHVYALL